MDIDLSRRFGGIDRLYGRTAASALQASSIAVIGIGGVGSWTAEALARTGVGRIVLVDMDHVSESNINRQLHSLEDTVGQAKISAMAERIARINPQCQVQLVDDFVTPENWPSLLPGKVDGVIDACDQIKSKTAMAAWAIRTKTPFVTVGAAGGKKLAHLVDLQDLSMTTHDPLLAQLRYRLRKHHGSPRDKKMGVACVFSREAVAAPDPSCALPTDGSLNCSGYGSIVTVTATFGMAAAGWMINRISELGQKKAL